MNATINQYYDGPECEFKVEFGSSRTSFQTKVSHRPTYSRRRGKTPLQFNGIHRRRRKKIKW